ncbi:YcgN family cysteine cluster protein [Alteromonas sp. LMIT006]|uniref:YcgN family cysteine cluster protein n=1 Tax=Alteromonadaceae TaxID=72275 RepID=UPI0020CA2C41|nr:YcgN family cysteine cluster protein [Alteromonas sp. LMIT006]UTP72522.1 YcgN family cysteine cluster protein [Alteromonas sp. LMIT006]
MAKTLTPNYQALLDSKYWEDTALQDMNTEQWEALCDGCAKCCLHKVMDDETVETPHYTSEGESGETVYFTQVACQYLHDKQCGCTVYATRTQKVPHCVKLTQDNLDAVFYMPPSCAYRRLHENKPLPSWHPLLNKGKKSKMHQLDMSVRGKTISENDVFEEDLPEHIVIWPLEIAD